MIYIKEFFMLHWMDICLILAFALVIGILLKQDKKEAVKAIVLSLVVQAEKTLGSGTGEFKYAMVIEGLYKSLPSIIRFLYSKKEIDTFIDQCVQKLKDDLESGKNLLGYNEGSVTIKPPDITFDTEKLKVNK